MFDLTMGFPVTDPSDLIWLVMIYVTAAFMSGLSGFGFSAIGALSLIYLPPTLAISMLMMLSLATQALSFSRLWGELRNYSKPWYRKDGVLPYFVGGVFGMPVGIEIMTVVDAKSLVLVFGLLLVLYSGYCLAKPTKPVFQHVAGWRSSLLVGACGGVIGGFTAFPGSVMVIWTALTGRAKEHGRALTQPFVFFMQLVGLILIAFTRPQTFNNQFVTLFTAMVPLALIGSWVGVIIYRRTSQVDYRKICFTALGLSGFGLLLKLGLSSA
jgi:uncharacterized membrane protein YfcA